jgi:hypothetical protein
LAFWLEFRDTSIRTEADAEAALELPLLVTIPWVSGNGVQKGGDNGGFWGRKKKTDEHRETIGV